MKVKTYLDHLEDWSKSQMYHPLESEPRSIGPSIEHSLHEVIEPL